MPASAVVKSHSSIETTIVNSTNNITEKQNAYSSAKAYLEKKGFQANIINGILVNPNTGTINKYENQYEYRNMLYGYKVAKTYLTNLGYSDSVINAVVVMPE